VKLKNDQKKGQSTRMPRKALVTGADDFGTFTIYANPLDEAEQCIYCGALPKLMLEYDDPGPNLKGIDTSATILEDDTAAIGVTCGCYAKFHRQVTHIRHSIGNKEKDKKESDAKTT